jgi:hypothetical protein
MQSKDERDSILLDTFKKNLLVLDKLYLTPHILRIKQHLQTRIAEIEQTLFPTYSSCGAGYPQMSACKPAKQGKRILFVSIDPTLTQFGKQLLELAGYGVIQVDSVEQIAGVCRNHTIDLVLLESSLQPDIKRKFWDEFRKHCNSVVLELYGDAAPELMDDVRTYIHHPVTSADFIGAVHSILSQA